MASPPPPYGHNNYSSSISPPYPSNAQLPQPLKRRQSDMPSSAPTIKRRKASMMSTTSATSTHPLRQTSFPPENGGNSAAFSRSPSMDTMSMASGMVPSGIRKKKPRKSKGKDNDEESIAGGRGTSTSALGKRRGSRDQTADISEDGGDEPRVEASAERKADRVRREARQRVIANHFDEQQFARYEAWRASRLPPATVRRIVNQTLSQSVPLPVIVAVQAAAKLFAGDMIEGARRVQSQWLEATGESQTGLPSPLAEGDGPTQRETRRGPLHPDHLREALRRHMLENNGGLVGELGLWQAQNHSGVERFGTKVGGKRLLK